jgi:LysR family glycine cleavage system transcriptional activator
MHELPPLDGLRTFHEVVRASSFTGAGRVLHVTQGAVSHRIRALEEQLGFRLFKRSARRVQLTSRGAILARATRDVFARLREAMREVEAYEERRSLTVSCSPSFALRWLVPHLVEYRELAPSGVRLVAEDRLVEPGFGGIDACIRYGPGNYPGVRTTRLTTEQVIAVASPLLLQRQPLDAIEHLTEHTLLHDEVLSEHPGFVGWARWLREAGSPLDAGGGLRFSHAHMALDAAVAGHGVALARRTLVERDLQQGRLVSPLAHSVRSGLAYWLLTPEGPQTGAVRRFGDWIVEALAGPEPST